MKRNLFYAFFFIISLSVSAQSYDLGSRKLTEQEVTMKCDRELSLMRNEIYARHGYQFSNKAVQYYFENYSWYSPGANNSEVSLNQVEQANVALIKKIEVRRQAKYNAIEKYFQGLKNAFQTNDKQYIDRVFSSMTEDSEKSSLGYLKEVLSRINTSDINYYKNKGMNRTEVDNGFVVMEYTLYVEDNKIQLRHSYQRHSDIIEDFDDCTDYMSEDEAAYMWNFRINPDNMIVFEYLQIAG